MSDNHYSLALSDLCAGYPALIPPKRVTVAEGAAENLVIKQPGQAGGPWSGHETPYMIEPMNTLASRLHEATAFVGPARTGKCLDIETWIPTPTGWKTMRELTAGDFVIGDDGRPTKVLTAHDVKYGRPCYELEFSDGTTLVSDDEHLWQVERFYWNTPNWRSEIRSTADLVGDFTYSRRADGRGRFRYRIRQPEPQQLPEADVPNDPYLLGVWLGNGSSASGSIVQDANDTKHYVEKIEAAGERTSVTADGISCTKIRVEGLTARLRNLGFIDNKHIPIKYLRGSVEQRVSLLRGLMDTDGYAGEKFGCEFSTTSEPLRDGFMELCRSLSLKVTMTQKVTTWTHNGKKRHSVAWRVYISVANDIVPFSLPRKLANFRPTLEDWNFRQIVDIRQVESRPVRCIAVDNESKLFLAGPGMVPTHNTAGLLLGWMGHTVRNDPGDTLFIQMSKDKAREFSKTDVDRAIRNSPNIYAMKSNRAIDSNTFDTMFRNGVWLRIAWPTVSNVSGSTYRYVAITDLDRIENAENVDGEGPLFDLARKRTTTFMSRGMCLAESSPGKDVQDANWVPRTPHEGPPVGGIVGIYNRSDRRRWYWQCPDCHDHFEAAPGLDLFHLPPDSQLVEDVRTMNIGKIAAEYGARIICPHCGSLIDAKHKQTLNSNGLWLPDGVRINRDREITGDPMVSTIAGFWLGGVAAAYQTWKSLIERHLQGLKDYALTGSEETLKATTNTDQGLPYTPRHLVESAGTKSLSDKSDASLQRYVVPEQTRCVAVAVDVQGGTNARFVVQVHAVGPYMEQWLVDRFEIRNSKREGMGAEFAPIDPKAHPEDWDVLTEKLLLATWRTPLEGREIKLTVLVVDTGGEQGGKTGRADDGGVAQNAYAWYRRVRARKDGLAAKIVLYKGASNPSAPIIRENKVGKRGANSKPDIPLLVCNPNLLSDQVDAGLKRDTPGPNFLHFPPVKDMVKNPDGFLPQAFFDELNAEVRQPNGTWKQIRKRNESFDLCRMIRAGLLRKGLDKIQDWNVVPAWLAPLELNSEVITVEKRREIKSEVTGEPAISEAPKIRIVGGPIRRPRRSAPSPYLR